MTRPPRATAALLAAALLALCPAAARAQDDDLVVRTPPPARDGFEVDANGDEIPDGGWYNLRDVKVAPGGVAEGRRCLRFENKKPGRPARISRAFGLDGRVHEAAVLGLWVRLTEADGPGERTGEEPALIIDFLGDGLRTIGRGNLGPWTAKAVGLNTWAHVVKRLPVPPGTRDAIMTIGMLGATGAMEVDEFTVDLVPVGGAPTTNLVLNGGFELGASDPAHWLAERGARRASPGFRSEAALELPESGSRALVGLSVSVAGFAKLGVSMATRGSRLRGGGGATATVFFLDDFGRPLPGANQVPPALRFSGTYDWRVDRAEVAVPAGAARAVLQVEKLDAVGSIRLDDVIVTAGAQAEAAEWTPYHIETDRRGWAAVDPSPTIAAGSALDFSFLNASPAGGSGPVAVKDGRLHHPDGRRARFFGAVILPPAAFQDVDKSDALADRLARSGLNLARLGDLDLALGPARCLFDDARDDTRELDVEALARLDHLIAALKARGISIALELQSARRYRVGDGLADLGPLPQGGGPAAAFHPKLAERELAVATALLTHVNPETGLALKDEPALAWLTLSGELSLFDLIDDPSTLPGPAAAALRTTLARAIANGRRGWQVVETAHWAQLAESIRKLGVKAPIATVSHWRREPEFAAVAHALDLVDDRLYWTPSPFMSADKKSLVWARDGALAAGASAKRRPDKPYAVGQWCDQTTGAWALPYESADTILASALMVSEDWDALARRGVFIYPETWGAGATGTAGLHDAFVLPESVSGIPQVFALWPHAASIALRTAEPAAKAAAKNARAKKPGVPGWDPSRGRFAVDTAYTQGVVGWPGGDPAVCGDLTVETPNDYAAVLASSATAEPIARSPRLLVTAIARVEPDGLRYVDSSRREVADPGRPPLLREPVRATITWRRPGRAAVRAFALDATGARAGPVPVEKVADGARVVLDGKGGGFHWELVAE